jgi:hypothetical protein
MIKKVLEALSQPLGRIGLGIAALALLSAAVWGIAETQKTPAQPIEFPHRLHVGLGLQCLFCHPGALRGPSPGIPTQTKCWGCHQQITVRGTELPKRQLCGEQLPIRGLVAQIGSCISSSPRVQAQLRDLPGIGKMTVCGIRSSN